MGCHAYSESGYKGNGAAVHFPFTFENDCVDEP